MTQNLYGLGDYNTEQIKEMANMLVADKMDPTLIYWRRPDAAPDPKEMVKSIPPEEVTYLVPDAFAGDEGAVLAAALSFPQLERIGFEGDPYLKQAIKLALGEAAKQKSGDSDVRDLNDYVHYSPAWQL